MFRPRNLQNINAAHTYMPPYDLQHAGNRFLHIVGLVENVKYILRQRAAHHACAQLGINRLSHGALCRRSQPFQRQLGIKRIGIFPLHFGSVQRRVCLLYKA